MHARNKKTGAMIVGTAERVEAPASVHVDRFETGAKGLAFEHSGWTESHWDTARTVRDETRGTLFIDEDGDTVHEDEIEPVHSGT